MPHSPVPSSLGSSCAFAPWNKTLGCADSWLGTWDKAGAGQGPAPFPAALREPARAQAGCKPTLIGGLATE